MNRLIEAPQGESHCTDVLHAGVYPHGGIVLGERNGKLDPSRGLTAILTDHHFASVPLATRLKFLSGERQVIAEEALSRGEHPIPIEILSVRKVGPRRGTPLDEPWEGVSLRTIDVLIPLQNACLSTIPPLSEIEVVVIPGWILQRRAGESHTPHSPSVRVNDSPKRADIVSK